jgi:hypothetical protein
MVLVFSPSGTSLGIFASGLSDPRDLVIVSDTVHAAITHPNVAVGVVQQVDAVANVFYLVTLQNEQLQFSALVPGTDFYCRGQTVTLSDFKFGDQVVVMYFLVEGKSVADSVRCTGRP